MNKLEQLLGESSIIMMKKTQNEAQKTSLGRELINNLIKRLERRGNLMIEMNGHFVKRVRINLSSNYFAPKEKNFSIWVKPFIRGHYLMLNYNGVVIRASDIFGDSINIVNL